MSRCADCRRSEPGYMVRDDLWSRVGTGVDGILCLSCLESRMGRPIAVDDLLLCGLTVQHPRLRAMINDLLARWPARGARKRLKKPRRLRPLNKRKALRGRPPGFGADLRGQRFGSLTVVAEAARHQPRNLRRWLCRCDCGEETTVIQSSLRQGLTTSCGCGEGVPAIDRVGQRYGRLVVLSRAPNRGETTRWWCRCDCGGPPVAVAASALRDGEQNTCGCGPRGPRPGGGPRYPKRRRLRLVRAQAREGS